MAGAGGPGAVLRLRHPRPADRAEPLLGQLRLPGARRARPRPSRAAATPLVPEGDGSSYEADAVVVGSGAGGGVIAAALAEAGQKVIVLEAGGLFDESDSTGYELWAYQNLYWRGGPNPTADMNVALYAGATLRRRHDDQLDQLPAHEALGARAVGARARARGPRRPRVRPPPRRRLGAPAVNDRCSHLNGTQSACRRAPRSSAGRSGRSRATSTSRATTPETAGFIGFGDPSGRQAVDRADLPGRRGRARRRGDRALLRPARAHRGRARRRRGGVYVDPETGRSARVTVRAPRVVVACGALESPALLLRSRHRRPGGGPEPAPAPLHRDLRAATTRTSAPGGARRTPASSTSSRTSRTATAS